MIMSCPVCEGQGNIYNAKVLDLGITIKICDEREACWPQDQIVSIENFKGLTSFLKEQRCQNRRFGIRRRSRCSLLNPISKFHFEL